MLGVNDNIKSYFDNSAAQILPLISGEWNYNLIYQPYATFSGNGTNYGVNYNSSNWVLNDTKLNKRTITNGYKTSIFSGNNIQFYVSPDSNTSDITNFQTSASISIPLTSPGAKCYKIIFYVKSNDNNLINLTSQVTNSISGFNATSFNVVDNIDWIKVEIVGGVQPTAPSFNNLNVTLDFFNTTLTGTSQWGITVSDIEIYEITYFDYLYGNLYPTSDVFTFFRPGESYITSGNANIQNPVRTIDTILPRWDVEKNAPISSIVYPPKVILGPGSNSIYKNGALTSFSQYKYFTSEVMDNPSIGAAYTELIDVNKIVIKLNLSMSKPIFLNINLYNKNLFVQSVTVSSSEIKNSGYVVLYFDGSSWSTNKWSKMPTINAYGNITISQKINKIVVSSGPMTIVDGYSNVSSESLPELKRLQVIEISPRMELDLSSFVLDYSITKELDDKSTPLPISSISANMATISLSNIPLAGPNNVPLSIFSTNANATNFTSPLKNLLVKNTKFYINFFIPDNQLPSQSKQNRIIPGGVFYADTWDNQDIKTTRINCFDIMKFLQTLPVSDYVSESQQLINIITNVMDFSGFTDYNYNELVSVLSNNNQKISLNYFFADSGTKTVYTTLKEMFLAYQIGAYVDEYGVLRFNDLQSIITKNTPTYTVDDTNIVVDSYNENIKTKIGKVRMLYKTPQVKKTLTFDAKDKAVKTIFTQSPDIIWKQDAEDVVPFNFLTDSISSLSQNYYQTDPATLDPNNLFYLTTFDHNSFIIIEGEIMSSGDKEILLSTSSTNPNPQKVSVSNQNDIDTERAKYSNSVGSSNIIQSPTGKYLNIHRGLFGTPASTHTVMKTANDISTKFDSFKMSKGSASFDTTSLGSISSSQYISFPIDSFRNHISPKSYDAGFSTYSTKFRFPSDSSGDITAGLFFHMAGNPTLTDVCYYVAISRSNLQYLLKVYSISTSGVVTNITSSPINITSTILSDFNNEPKIPIYSTKSAKFINLKFVNLNGKVSIYVNKHKVNLVKLIDQYLPETGKIIKKTIPLFNFNISNIYGTRFGFFTESSTNGISTSVELAEVYATESAIDEPVSYHFQTKNFLNKIIDNKKINEKFVFVQCSPQIIGLNYYDVQLTPGPSLGAEPFKVMYNLYYIDQNNAKQATNKAPAQLISVFDSALSYSTILSTGFRARFAVSNNSQYVVWTKTGTEYNKSVAADFFIGTRNLITLTEQQTAERILNPQNANEVIELQSDWIQDKKSAMSILKVLANSSEWFSKDITIEIFGNPLIQVGDVLSLTHTLKNISSLTFFVQSVKQTFNQGLKTVLTINQIGYNGTGSSSKKLVSPTTGASGGIVKNLKISPNNGSTNGGDVVTITSDNFPSNPIPAVYFGEEIADSISYVNSTTLTALTPAANTAGTVDVSVVTNGVTSVAYNAFTYTNAKPNVGPISNLQYSSVPNGFDSTLTDVTLTWVPGINNTDYNWTVDTSGSTNFLNTVPAFHDQGSSTNDIFGYQFIPGLKGKGIASFDFTITPKNISNGVETLGTTSSLRGIILGSVPTKPTSIPNTPRFKTTPGWVATSNDKTIGTLTIPIVKDSSSTKPTSYKLLLKGTGNAIEYTFEVSNLSGGSDYYNLIIQNIDLTRGTSFVPNVYFYTLSVYAINSYGINQDPIYYQIGPLALNTTDITNRSVNNDGVVTFNGGSGGIDQYSIYYVPTYDEFLPIKIYSIDLASNWVLKDGYSNSVIPNANQVFSSPNSFNITPPKGNLSSGTTYDASVDSLKNGVVIYSDPVGKFTTPQPPSISYPPSIPVVTSANDVRPIGGTFTWAASGTGPITYNFTIFNSDGSVRTSGSSTYTSVQVQAKGKFTCFVTASNSAGTSSNSICPTGYSYEGDNYCTYNSYPYTSIAAGFTSANGCTTATFT